MRYCHMCGVGYTGAFCPVDGTQLATDKPNSQTKRLNKQFGKTKCQFGFHQLTEHLDYKYSKAEVIVCAKTNMRCVCQSHWAGVEYRLNSWYRACPGTLMIVQKT